MIARRRLPLGTCKSIGLLPMHPCIGREIHRMVVYYGTIVPVHVSGAEWGGSGLLCFLLFIHIICSKAFGFMTETG